MKNNKHTKSAFLPAIILALCGCANLSADTQQFAYSASGLLTDSQGRTLYTFDKDQQGQSKCYGPCAEKWPPVLSTRQWSDGGFSTAKRTDGSLQVRYNNKPLYLWVGDKQPGDSTGDGVKGVWHIVTN